MPICRSALAMVTFALLAGACARVTQPSPRQEAPPPVEAARAVSSPTAESNAGPPPPERPAPPRPPRYSTLEGPELIPTTHGRAVDVLAGRATARASPPPLITVLHAMCLSAEDNCTFLRPLADGRGMLVCPIGNAVCSDGSATWEGAAAARAAYVRESVTSAERALEEAPDPARGDVLFGSSRGAYVARDVIYEGPDGRWTGLVLVGAEIALDPVKVRRAGVRRVLLAAPDFDGAAATMRRGQAALCRAGIPARFVSLGPHPHGMREDSPGILAESMDWVMGREATDACGEAARR
jgi:hypothetical protein